MGKMIFVVDIFSDVVLYIVKGNSITMPAELASDNLENLPTWSKDGRKLYYICADKITDTLPYDVILYNLMSIGFDEEKRESGHTDILISAGDFGKSISFPGESPPSGIISFLGPEYGYCSVYNKEAYVYFFNSETGALTMPGLNSEFTGSYPSWPGNGSWLMFVSKRDVGLLSQVLFSHIDENSNAGKPFVLPQSYPDFYADYQYNYNRPDFISGKVQMYPGKLFGYVRKGIDSCSFNMAASVSATTGAIIPAVKLETDFYHHN
jgi:Tol biopolymer transport system component